MRSLGHHSASFPPGNFSAAERRTASTPCDALTGQAAAAGRLGPRPCTVRRGRRTGEGTAGLCWKTCGIPSALRCCRWPVPDQLRGPGTVLKGKGCIVEHLSITGPSILTVRDGECDLKQQQQQQQQPAGIWKSACLTVLFLVSKYACSKWKQ